MIHSVNPHDDEHRGPDGSILIPGAREAELERESKSKQQSRRRQNIKVLSDRILAVVTILLFGVNSYQAYLSRKSTDAATNGARAAAEAVEVARESLEESKAARERADRDRWSSDAKGTMLADASRDLSQRQSNAAIEIAEKSIRASSQSARLDRRPWVGLVNIGCECELHSVEGQEFQRQLSIKQLMIVIHNIGRTPAINARVRSAVITNSLKATPIPTWKSIDRSTANSFAEEVLVPGAPRQYTVAGGISFRYSLQEAVIPVYVVGNVSYEGSEHTDVAYDTDFCWMIDESGQRMKPCPVGNRMR